MPYDTGNGAVPLPYDTGRARLVPPLHEGCGVPCDRRVHGDDVYGTCVRPGPLPGTAVALARSAHQASGGLHADEERLAGGMTPGRRADFVAGRRAAARALAALGCAGPVLREGRRPLVAAVDAAAAAGVKRWIQLSMWGTADASRLPGYLRDTARAKLAADDHLGQSGLTWTVVRPPWLTDGAPTGRITVGDEVEEGSLSRDDLAAVLVAALDHSATFHRAFEVTGGGQPISGALDSLGV